MLRMVGLRISSINGAVWYISSMLLCMVIMYPLIRKYPDLSVKFILPLSAILMMGYFCANGRSPRAPAEWMGWTYRGNIRAFAELSIGVCCFEVCQRFRKHNFTTAGKWLLTIIEYSIYILILWYMYFNKSSRRDYFYIILYAIAIIITFSEKTVDMRMFNNKLCHFLGKYSFCLYLSHAFYAKYLKNILSTALGNKEKMLIYLACSVATGAAVMLISDVIRKKGPLVFGKLRKLIVE